MKYNKEDLVLYAKQNNIPNYSRITRPELEAWIMEWDSYTPEEKSAYAIPLRYLKYFAVKDYELTNVQHYTKKTKIDLIRIIINS